MRLRSKLTFGFFLLLAMIFVYGGYILDKNGKDSSNWEPTSGKVVSSRVVEEERSHGKGNRIEYNPLISYEYESPYGKLRSNKVTHNGPAIKIYRFQAEKVVARYKLGMPVVVYFNPNNPKQSCLEPGRTRDGIALMVIGLLVFLGVLVSWGFRSLDRYAGMGEFSRVDVDVNKKVEKRTTKSGPTEKKETTPSLLQEYIEKAQKSKIITQHVETHLVFGPMYRKTIVGDLLFGFLNFFLGKRLLIFNDEKQIFFIFLLTKIVLGGMATLFVLMSPFLFLMKAPDALADLLLGLIWLPGLEFIPKLTPNQKYISVCRLLFTIPAIYLGVNSGNWGW